MGTKLKKILILYADAGFGHRSAALAIQAAMEKLYGDRCHVRLENPLDDERVPTFLRESQADYDRIIKSAPELYRFGYEASDAGLPATLMDGAFILMLFDVMKELVDRRKPDAIVTTYPVYQAPLDALFTTRKVGVPLLTVVTDLVSTHRIWFNRGVDQCLVPTEEVRALAIQGGIPDEKIKVFGIPVSPLISEEKRSKSQIRKALGLKTDLITLLVLGSKRIEGVPEILSGINHSRLPVQLLLVAGGDDELLEKYQQVEWHVPVQIHNFVENVPALMHASDLIVCKAGGLAVSESLAAGLPMLLVNVLPGQEQGNADYVVSHGCGELINDPLHLLETLHHWLDQDGKELAVRTKRAQELGHADAAYRVADEVWRAANCPAGERSVTHLFERSHLVRMLREYRKDLEEITRGP
jgi:1,2-diacylglycerol 3-beta-galactosyltransferase